MGGQRALGVAAYAGQNLVCRLGPNERRGILIVDLNVFADGPFQFLHAAKHAAANPFVGECGEPSLDQVQPGVSMVGAARASCSVMRVTIAMR